MQNPKYWNVELLYSTLFFVSAIVVFYNDLGNQIFNYVYSLENILLGHTILINIARAILLLINTVNTTLIISFSFLLCSIYSGIRSMNKDAFGVKRIVFGLIPQSIIGYLAFIQAFISFVYVIVTVLLVV